MGVAYKWVGFTNGCGLQMSVGLHVYDRKWDSKVWSKV